MVSFAIRLNWAWSIIRHGNTLLPIKYLIEGFEWVTRGGNYLQYDLKSQECGVAVVLTLQRVGGETPLDHLKQITHERDNAMRGRQQNWLMLSAARALLRDIKDLRELPPALLERIDEELNKS